jgi:FMN phosphatase YigB (HAD superfamily)
MPQARKLILWDLDGTLCPHNTKFHENAIKAIAMAVLNMGVDISMSQALDYVQKKYPGQRTAIGFFADKFDLDADEIFQEYYRFLKDDFLEKDNNLMQIFKNNQDKFEHGILTNASQIWINKALSKIGIMSFFNAEFLFGNESLGGLLKTEDKAVDFVIRKTMNNGYTKDDIIIVDDKKKVLSVFKKICKNQILISQDKQKIDVISYISCSNPSDVFAVLFEG